MLDESDDEVQIVREVRPGKRRRDNRQPVIVLCGEGSKKLARLLSKYSRSSGYLGRNDALVSKFADVINVHEG